MNDRGGAYVGDACRNFGRSQQEAALREKRRDEMSDRRSPRPRRRLADRRAGDRRQEARRPFERSVRFLRTLDGGRHVFEGELIDVSAKGIRLLAPHPLAIGECLLVEVRLGADLTFNLSARCRWCEPTVDGCYRIGCVLAIALKRRQLLALQSFAGQLSAR
ncbi:MAG: PilZ domain-containing protein [Planctomycetota bacterium]|nr:MAG: PilZ domain-containing protein [Planctomycetota bacterium]